MRILIFTLMLLFLPISCVGQEAEKPFVDYRLQEYVLEFIEEGDKRGFDARPYIKLLDSIYIKKDMDLLIMGKYKPEYDGYTLSGEVQINVYCTVDSLMLRWVVFHELGHACGYLGHSCEACDNIMSKYPYKDFTYGIYIDEAVWHKYVNILFNNLKSIPERDNLILTYIKSKQ